MSKILKDDFPQDNNDFYITQKRTVMNTKTIFTIESTVLVKCDKSAAGSITPDSVTKICDNAFKDWHRPQLSRDWRQKHMIREHDTIL